MQPENIHCNGENTTVEYQELPYVPFAFFTRLFAT